MFYLAGDYSNTLKVECERVPAATFTHCSYSFPQISFPMLNIHGANIQWYFITLR